MKKDASDETRLRRRRLHEFRTTNAGLSERPSMHLRRLCVMLAALVGLAGAHAVGTEEEGSSSDLDVAAGRKAIEAKKWTVAIEALSSAALRDPANADIQNWLGYAHRNAGNLPQAFEHYGRALKLNPRHRGAHEYVGEAYLSSGRPEKAEEHLKALQAICVLPCEQLNDLKEKIERYRQRKP